MIPISTSRLREAAAREPLGLYLHVPFCRDRCTYCSFVTTRDESLKEAVLARLERDLRDWGARLGRPRVDTLYLGGGTPSLLTAPELARLTGAAREAFHLDPAEATLEANPGTLDLPWLEAARDQGWDRVSFGVQALDDVLLERLGRIHDSAAALEALDAARRAGFTRVSADLMVGIPGQRLDRVLQDARTLVEAGASHLSIYLLDLDKACPLRGQVDSGKLALPTEDEVADVFEALQAELPRLGLEPYEVSNYARPGQESIHNSRYWERRPYLGLGPSAASQLGDWRWTESGVITAWAEDRGRADIQELDAAEALAEIPLLGLRMHRGVHWGDLRARAAALNLLPLADAWEAKLEPFVGAGILLRDGEVLRFSARGMLVSNGVLEIFV
ncbi:radical SAM family heme chaperone HemW [Mesoterricola silvestris]|uniref:Heme chaperone HemW n=1 Tax=Mesoterricola silvestris TaxID=2927979 RepID=A0AA48GV52_9BACT|nr:radical SAM family heme chaperone HemW [Mesoterricola silvestris]BDU74627.1 coproporphyrinogen III oxidase [Mesoterricola silvestris]